MRVRQRVKYVYGQEQTFQCSCVVHIKLGAPYIMKTFSLYRRAHGRSLKALEQAYEHHNLKH